MPELPEVETMRRDLKRMIGQAPLQQVEVRDPQIIVGDAQDFTQGLTGRRIAKYDRRGKVLILTLDNGAQLLAHPRMTGRFFGFAADETLSPHARIVVSLENGRRIVYDDIRRFGRLELLPPKSTEPARLLRQIGPDALQCDAERIYRAMQRRSIPIKVFLLDQRVVAGIGNIYASEILFNCGLDPRTPCHAIKRAEAEALARETERLLAESITLRGTTISDYRTPLGGTGKFQDSLRVYGRDGEPCSRPGCRGTIKRIVQAARSTFFCTHCQRTGRTRK